MLNTIQLVGRLTRDPELRTTNGGKAVCNMRLAVDGRSDSDTLFVDVVTFEAQAENCAKYLAQGRLVAVEGRLVYREWEAEDGAKRSKHEVVGRVQFLPDGRKNDDDTVAAPAEESVAVGVGAGGSDDDIGF